MQENEHDWRVNQTNGDSNDNDESWVSADSLSLKTAEEDSPIKVAISEDSTTKSKQLKSESSIELSEVTSDSDVSYINYYDVEKSQVYKKSTEESIRKEKNEDQVLVPEIFNSDFVKKKPLYNKVNSVTPLRFNKDTTIVKKRHKSESDLISEDSFDAPPKVLSKKKDNTLISKIYSQPHVRNFALTSRKQVPGDLSSPTTPTSSIYESSRYNGKVALYNSEGEMSYERKSAFSSTEDLIEPTPKQQSFVRSSSGIINSNGQRKNSVSSEDDVLSEYSSIVGLSAKRNSKHHIYSSSDDLFSIEEQELPQKKKDNTLIDKIYQNPQVRNYGLSNRDYIPVQINNNIPTTPIKKVYSSEDDIPDIKIFTTKSEISISQENTNQPSHYGPNYGTHLASEFNFHLEKPTEEIPIRNLSTPDPEIDEIAKKKIVHSLLDKFGGSRPEITPRTKLSNDKLELNDSENEINVSVKELMKKFENKNVSIHNSEFFVNLRSIYLHYTVCLKFFIKY